MELKLEVVYGTGEDVITLRKVICLHSQVTPISSQLQTCRPNQTLSTRKIQSPLQKLFLPSINKNAMLKIGTVNTGTITPDNQNILSDVKCLFEFIFSFVEVPS